jgi:hypothetical protein
MKRQSPLYSADKIKTPLMVVQGANDPRVNKREADQIVVALRDRNYPVEYLLAPDEGHGFARPVNNMAMFAAAEKFLAKYLGGRYQETATPEVTKRLTEITVDPKTVMLVKAADMSAAPGANVTGKWSWTVDAGGQQIPIDIDLKQDGATFGGSSASPLGTGTIVDGKVAGTNFTAVLKADLQGQQVDIKIEGKIDGSKATGTLNVPGYGMLPFSGVKQ